ncbi:MAG: hypothetical protein DMG53_00230 [Acidobacteria bacterium]|nr:MAG: hypothetical protein DMG53_00230 [Acidobacteriota bacterium]
MKSSRRSFLEAGLALPVLLGASPSFPPTSQTSEAAASKDSSFDPWVEIHGENLRHNVQEISRRASSRPILAVIKPRAGQGRRQNANARPNPPLH